MALKKNKISNRVISDRHHRLTAGQYKGQTVDEVLKGEQPWYLIWLSQKTDQLDLHHLLLEEAELDTQQSKWELFTEYHWKLK